MNRKPGFAVATALLLSFLVVGLLYRNSPERSGLSFPLLFDNEERFDDAHESASGSRYSHNFNSGRDVTDTDLEDILNRTVGFEKVFVVNLASRTDRLDAFTMQASTIEMDFEIIPGVNGSEVPDKVLPYGMSRQGMGSGAIGCWRSHLNIYQKMVQHSIQSALVFEDDADFDLAFKYQMVDYARGTRFLLNSSSADTVSAYGDDWDFLWMGHNSIKNPPEGESRRRWVTHDDPTVVPPRHRHGGDKLETSYWDDQRTNDRQFYSRVLVIGNGGWGFSAYAVSLRGARKILYHQSMTPFREPVDVGVENFVSSPQKYSNFTCVASYPKLVGYSFPAGPANKGTDIENHGQYSKILETATSKDLMYSTRLNVQNVFMGNKSFISQYADDVGSGEMTMEEISERIRGRAERLDPDENGVWKPFEIPGALFSR